MMSKVILTFEGPVCVMVGARKSWWRWLFKRRKKVSTVKVIRDETSLLTAEVVSDLLEAAKNPALELARLLGLASSGLPQEVAHHRRGVGCVVRLDNQPVFVAPECVGFDMEIELGTSWVRGVQNHWLVDLEDGAALKASRVNLPVGIDQDVPFRVDTGSGEGALQSDLFGVHRGAGE